MKIPTPPYSTPERKKPEDSHIFTTSDGEKIRLRFDSIQIYKSDGNNTIVDIGWGDKKTFILDVAFDTLDEMILNNRKAWDEYWKAEYSSWD